MSRRSEPINCLGIEKALLLRAARGVGISSPASDSLVAGVGFNFEGVDDGERECAGEEAFDGLRRLSWSSARDIARFICDRAAKTTRAV